MALLLIAGRDRYLIPGATIGLMSEQPAASAAGDRRGDLKRELLAIYASTLDARVERYLEVNHQGIIPNHHFAAASSECLDLYKDGYFLSAVMVSQAVVEGIWRFVLERNDISPTEDRPALAVNLVESRILTQQCADAFVRIWRSFRNDVHHMNAKVVAVPFEELAKRNLTDLATIEHEVFAFRVDKGKLRPVHRKYWDLKSDGTVPVFLRLA